MFEEKPFEETHAYQNAVAHADGIVELVDKHDEIPYEELDALVLSVQYRSGWSTSPKNWDLDQIEILLSTGGPACRVLIYLSGNGEIQTAIECQDWGMPWREISLTPEQRDAVNTFGCLWDFEFESWSLEFRVRSLES